MSEKIVQLTEEVIKVELKELVHSNVEKMLNELLEQEAQQLTNAAKYERSEDRQGYYREVIGATEDMKEDQANWVSFFQWLKSRGLDGVKLVVDDKCMGMLEAMGEVFPNAKYQRCTVPFYRNIFSVTPRSKVKLVAKMLKAIHAQESKNTLRGKATAVIQELHTLKLPEAANKVEDGIDETLTYADFPFEHWTRIRTHNILERLNREICRPDKGRTKNT